MHPDLVDEKGRPLFEFDDRDFGDAVYSFAKCDIAAGNAAIARLFNRVRGITDEIQRLQELEQLQFDSEALYDEGERAVAIALLRAVARWVAVSDLEFPAVEYAQRKLTEIGESW